MKTTALLLFVSALLATHIFAAIPLRGCNDHAMTFDTQPVATEWASASISGASGDIINSIQLDARVQTNAATRITNVLGNSTLSPPLANALAQWSSPGKYIQTRPANNAATLLMARVDSAFAHGTVDIFFEFGIREAAPEEQLGVRAYFSTNGAPGNWQFITELSNATSVAWSLNPGFSAGGLLYLLFADDNASPTDTGFSIDNFGAIGYGDPSPITITNQPQNGTVAERGNATFTAQAIGAPQCFFWFRDGNPIPGAHGNNYTLTNASYPLDNGAQYSVVVSNVLYPATSTVAVLTVLPDTEPPVPLQAVGEVALNQITIRFSEALNPATINEANFILYESGTDPVDSPYLTLSATLADGTNVTLLTENREADKNYSVAILEVQDNSSQFNTISPSPTSVQLRQSIQLIGFDANNEWKYDINHGDRSGTGWERIDFDDTDWPAGVAGLGRDLEPWENAVPIRTTVPYNSDNATAYFRKRFVFPGSANGTVLRLRSVIDDGAVFYLNGQEVLRENIGPGPLTFSTRALSGALEPTQIKGPFFLPTTNLFPGENVLAVEVHQAGSTSGDLEMAAELTAEITSYCNCALHVVVQPKSQTVLEGQNVTLSVQVEGTVPLTYQWYKNYSPVSNGTYPFLSIFSANPTDAGEYFVVVSNSLSVVTSQVAIIWMEGPLPPLFISAQKSGNPTNISLSFSQNLATDAAQDISNYNVRVQGGEETLAVFSAVLANARNIILTTEPRLSCENYEITITNLTDNFSQAVKPYARILTPTVPLTVPRIAIWRYPNGELTVDWTACRGTLQQAASLQNANTAWTNVPGNPTNYIFLPTAGENRFFRVVR
jgi:hypothetical protein